MTFYSEQSACDFIYREPVIYGPILSRFARDSCVVHREPVKSGVEMEKERDQAAAATAQAEKETEKEVRRCHVFEAFLKIF